MVGYYFMRFTYKYSDNRGISHIYEYGYRDPNSDKNTVVHANLHSVIYKYCHTVINFDKYSNFHAYIHNDRITNIVVDVDCYLDGNTVIFGDFH
jgi:hypothetical protein